MKSLPETGAWEDPIISARGLTRLYLLGNTEVVGLDGVSVDIRRGDLVVLKGDSGSGKSTFLSLVAALDRPSRGELTVAGYRLDRATERDLTVFRREVTGVVFQNFNLLPTLTLLENVCLPALLAGRPEKEVRAKAMEWLHWMHLAPRTDHLPSQLSGGECQRAAIARALINDPAVILADEPTGNLDSRNGRVVVELLATLNREFRRTVVIATHSTMADPYATVQLYLRDGRIVDRACESASS